LLSLPYFAKAVPASGRGLLMQTRRKHPETETMSWKAPRIVEVALGAEINSYACAEAKK
jgi:coenzyme PQQ precursor peptide PqqA